LAQAVSRDLGPVLAGKSEALLREVLGGAVSRCSCGAAPERRS
jgi:hypothetical protein